jgi:hypothetical protein
LKFINYFLFDLYLDWILWTRNYAPLPSKNVNLKELNSQIEPVKSTDEEEEFVLKTAAAAMNPSSSPVDVEVPHTTDKSKATTATATGTSTDKKEKYNDPNLYSDKYKISLNTVKISAMNFVSQCRNENFLHGDVEGGPLTEREYQALVDLLLDEDSYVISLYHNFKDDPKLFVKYSRKKAQDAIRRAEKKKEEAAKQAAATVMVPVIDTSNQSSTPPSQPPPQQPSSQPSPSSQNPPPSPPQQPSGPSASSTPEDDIRKKKIEHLLHEIKAGKGLVEEIKHPKPPQEESKKEETTTTAQVIASS